MWQLKTIAPLFFLLSASRLYVTPLRNAAKKRRSFTEPETDNGCCLAAGKMWWFTVVNCVGVDNPSPDGETCHLYIRDRYIIRLFRLD